MYEAQFGLNKNPFLMTPDPGMLFLTSSHREVLAGLCYAIVRRKGFVVVAGQAGTGKTTLIRKLLTVIPESEARTSVVFNPTLTPAEFLELLLMNFGLRELPASKAQRLALLGKLLEDAHGQRKAVVLIIDEAHNLSPEVLEEIRLLSNFETADEKLLQILLVGQPELNEVLNRQQLWQLKQRIAVRLQTGALSTAEVHEYLNYRWAKAGAVQPLPFTKDAISAIATWSRGIPRVMNAICDNALSIAFSLGVQVAGPDQVLEAVRDLDIQPAGGTPEKLKPAPLPSRAPEENTSSAVSANGSAPPLSQDPLRLSMLSRYPAEKPTRSFFRRWTAKSPATS